MGRQSIIPSLLVIFCLCQKANAQFDPDKNYLYSSYTGMNADANIFNDLSLNSYELLSTNVQFSKDEDLQKVVFVPFKLFPMSQRENEHCNFLYNTKLNLAQKSGISTLGIGFTWDNSMPGTDRGQKIFEKYSKKATGIKKILNTDLLKTLKSDIEKNNKKELEFVLSADMVEYINSLISRLEANPIAFSLVKAERSNFLKKDGFTYEDYLYYQSKVATYNSNTKTKFDNELTNEYYKALITNSFKVTFGGNLSLYSILGSDNIDLDNDNLNDNEFSLQQRNLSLGFTHIVDEVWGYSLTGYYLQKRASAEAENDLEPYFGFSAAVGIRTWILDKNYKTSKDYLESLFVPSVHTGIALEYLDCNAGEDGDCADGILRTTSITPYVEFKINPKNQFRLGIPISQNDRLDSDKAEIGPFIQWRLQLSGKN